MLQWNFTRLHVVVVDIVTWASDIRSTDVEVG